MTDHAFDLETPVGRLRVHWGDGGERIAADWTPEGETFAAPPTEPRALDLADRLAAYFEGTPSDFSDVPTPDGPDFHRRCWDACRSIPRGETRTYGQLATMAGSTPSAARAAGQAMRRNPLPVVVPCHRVVAEGGGLGGYQGTDDPASGRLDRKRWLLRLEAAAVVADEPLTI